LQARRAAYWKQENFRMSNTSAAEPQAPVERARWQSAKKVIQSAASPVAWTCALFGGAGRLDWKRGWVCLVLYTLGMSAISLVVSHFNPSLMQARSKWRRADTKSFDKIFLGALIPFGLLQPAVAGLDVVRFRWSALPLALGFLGSAIFALAIALIAWSLAVNPYAETTMRIQADRGHTVVVTGPYRMVRHPMYVGSILMYVATPLILGSFWALAFTAFIVVLFIWRTALEDRMLRRELAGYEEFTARTSFRLVPGLW
jgi:protein-S-isoprenylcysteine O-methyltransferase Ste14